MPATLHIDVTLTDAQIEALEMVRSFFGTEDQNLGITLDSSLEDVYKEAADMGASRVLTMLMKEGSYYEYQEKVRLSNGEA